MDEAKKSLAELRNLCGPKGTSCYPNFNARTCALQKNE